MGSECNICIRFSKIFSGDPTPPLLLRKDKKFPALAFPQQLRWKFSHITYIEDSRSEIWKQKLHTILGEKSTPTRQKWAQNAPFASVFQKFSRGTPTPPPPLLLRKDKKFPALAFPQQLRWKFSHITYIEDSRLEIWKQKLHTIFGEKIDTNLAKKMGSECTICIHFSKKFPGEGPGPPPAGRVIPLPHPTPCGASRRFGYAPRQWTLWIRH